MRGYHHEPAVGIPLRYTHELHRIHINPEGMGEPPRRIPRTEDANGIFGGLSPGGDIGFTLEGVGMVERGGRILGFYKHPFLRKKERERIAGEICYDEKRVRYGLLLHGSRS
jgi:hypothetical protein